METYTLKKTKIVVLGANGQLGQEFRHLASSYEYFTFEFYDRKDVDITDKVALNLLMDGSNPDFLINCAAYTAVDKAETDRDSCYAVNTDACSVITEVLTGRKVRLIHFSSDYVYHQYLGFPIRETDEPNPQGVYAQSKLEGEKIIRTSQIPALIIRTSWVISSFGHNFLKTMLRLGNEKPSLQVINDQYGAPTYARHLAQAVLDIILITATDEKKVNYFNDTYNFANEGIITWYDLADRIMKEAGLKCIIHPITTADYPTLAKRPHWSLLSKHKIKERYELEIPHWYVALKECMDEIKNKE